MSTEATEPTIEQTELDPIVAAVARNIRMLLGRDNISLTVLADAIDLKQPSLSKRMNGTVAWSLTDLLDVARYFRVPLSTITPDTLTEEALR